jgi:hypothetical protein
MMEDVVITDSLARGHGRSAKDFLQYGAVIYTRSENRLCSKQRQKLRKETEVKEEEEIGEDIRESCGWGVVPEWIKYNMRIHRKVVQPRKRST